MSGDTPQDGRWVRAPAKVNLTLHVLGRRLDGLHELDSLVAFARCGDALRYKPGDRLSLVVEGANAREAGPIDENLVLRAARALAERVANLRLGRFELFKRLPVAAGLGGGSSDAAAALQALAQENQIGLDDRRVVEAAKAVGADVPVCLGRLARRMSGSGDELGAPMELPLLFAVLANPRIPTPTPEVFRGLQLAPGAGTGNTASPLLTDCMNPEALIAALAIGRNDLEASALRVTPAIGDVLRVLRASKGVRLARMSGSGATCFALFATCGEAVRAARLIRAASPSWWIRATILR